MQLLPVAELSASATPVAVSKTFSFRSVSSFDVTDSVVVLSAVSSSDLIGVVAAILNLKVRKRALGSSRLALRRAKSAVSLLRFEVGSLKFSAILSEFIHYLTSS